MSFPLFQFITPLSAHPDPNGGVANGMAGLQSLIDVKRDRQHQAQQASQFGQELDLSKQRFGEEQNVHTFERQKVKAALIGDYLDRLKSGDYAGAAGMAPQMQALGLEPKLHPEGTPGASPDEWAAGQASPEEPAQTEPQPEPQAPQQPASKPLPRDVPPPLLSKFMFAQPQTTEEAPAEATPEAAKARVEAVGGNPNEVKAPEPVGGPQLPVFEFIDTETGKSYGVIDPNKAKAQNLAEAGRRGAAFTESLPEETGGAFAEGLQHAETGPEAKDAIHDDLMILLQGMRSKNKGKGGAPVGAFPVGKEAHALQTEIRTTMQAAATDQKVADSNKTLNNISQGLAGLQEGGTVAERGAVAQLIKSAFPGAISDQERGYITEANGIQGKIANALGYWVESGHMDPGLVAQVKRLQEISAALTKERLANASAEVAENWGRTHPELSPAAREAYIQEGISLHSPEAAKNRRDRAAGKRPDFLK